MRIRVSGPHLGPVRTTLWSSGGKKNGTGGKVLAAVFLLPALALLILQLRYWPFAVFVAAIAALMLFGRWAQKREQAEDAEIATLKAARLAAEAARETSE
jgi:hypothetical protein